MALGSLLLFLALLIIVALIVARPLTEGLAEKSRSMDDSSRWLAERERVLDALTELGADWQLGKVPEEIYATQREQLVAKGAVALEALEKENTSSKEEKPKVGKEDALDELIAVYKAQRQGRK